LPEPDPSASDGPAHKGGHRSVDGLHHSDGNKASKAETQGR
jgi:hypothetical protein